LENVEFKPAQQFFSRDETRELFAGLTSSIENTAAMSLGEAIMLFGGLLLFFVLLLMILSPEARKRLIKTVLRVGLTAWAISYVITRLKLQGNLANEAQAAMAEQAPEILLSPPPYTPPAIPGTILYITSLAVVLSLVGAGFLLYKFSRPPDSPFRNLAGAARLALRDLSSGRRWDDAVISCYIRMSAAVSEHRGLLRQSAMTPAEFAQRLEYAGLPSDPVRRLTRLFEKARYSGHSSSTEDVNEAVACLSSILHAVGE
jgi:hypothetical protein